MLSGRRTGRDYPFGKKPIRRVKNPVKLLKKRGKLDKKCYQEEKGGKKGRFPPSFLVVGEGHVRKRGRKSGEGGEGGFLFTTRRQAP